MDFLTVNIPSPSITELFNHLIFNNYSSKCYLNRLLVTDYGAAAASVFVNQPSTTCVAECPKDE